MPARNPRRQALSFRSCRLRQRITFIVKNLHWSHSEFLEFGFNFRAIARCYHYRRLRMDIGIRNPLHIFGVHLLDSSWQLVVLIER